MEFVTGSAGGVKKGYDPHRTSYQGRWTSRKGIHIESLNWVAVKELKLSYYIGETLLFNIYIPIMVT